MSLESLVSSFGLPGITLGVAIEGDAVAFFGGVLAHRGLFPVEVAALAATLGALICDHSFFYAGRHAGRRPRVQSLLESRAVGRLRGALMRNPDLFVLCFRFFYGVRSASAALIGTTDVPWVRFAILNLLAAVVWAHAVTWLGYAGGAAIHRVLGDLETPRHLAVAAALAAVFALAVLLLHRRLLHGGEVRKGGA